MHRSLRLPPLSISAPLYFTPNKLLQPSLGAAPARSLSRENPAPPSQASYDNYCLELYSQLRSD